MKKNVKAKKKGIEDTNPIEHYDYIQESNLNNIIKYKYILIIKNRY